MLIYTKDLINASNKYSKYTYFGGYNMNSLKVLRRRIGLFKNTFNAVDINALCLLFKYYEIELMLTFT